KLEDNQMVISNGMNFRKEHIELLKGLKIGIQLSLFATDVSARMDVMKGSLSQNQRAIDTLDLFESQGIEYGVTIVPYKKYLRNGVMEKIFSDLKGHHVKEFVMHKPGYTKLTPANIVEELNIPDQELLDFGAMIWDKYQMNVRIEGVLPVEKNVSEFLRLSKSLEPLRNLGNKFKLFLCSPKAHSLIKLVLRKMEMQDYELKPVESHVFGGSVDCAGLLTVEDYVIAINEYLTGGGKKVDFIVMSKRSFDINKEDLKMVSVYKLEEIFNAKVLLV
ncbi:MAG: hypothetical protein KGJ11_01125, partial [Candidatus Omnitrophica bacterium]|nr:hypothetical protein [Candidatus Omnitrophota bacterium]